MESVYSKNRQKIKHSRELSHNSTNAKGDKNTDRFQIGIDVEGTFTDLILYNTMTRESNVVKVPTTTKNPESAIVTALCDLCKKPEQV
jgi:hypothetical protein